MLAVAGNRLLPTLLLPPCRQLTTSNLTNNICRRLSSRAAPLSLFICAVDEESDRAGAALVTALKNLTGRSVELHGVGGDQLAFHGLDSIVSGEQLQMLAAAEVIPPTYKLVKDPNGVSKHNYAKLFKDTIWEAALDGCRGKPAQQQQQQQGQNSSSSSDTAARHLCYDAVISVGSSTAAQLTLNFLREAERLNKARLPVMVQYTAPGLWDHQTATAAAARWSKLVDHVMCSLPFEPRLLQFAGVPATFVGHPLLQQLLGSSSSSAQSIGGRARLLSDLLQQQQQQQQQQQSVGRRQQQQQQQDLFSRVGNAAAFWRSYEQAHALQQEAAAAAAAAEAEAAASSSSSIMTPGRPGTKHKTQQPVSLHQQQQQWQQQQQQQGRLLLALLPGETEAEVISSMAAFDDITQQLHQQYPDLIATLHVPDVLVSSAVTATMNFKVPVLVVTSGEKRAADALAAATAAVSHPGTASLQAVAAGVPLICVRDGSMLRNAWSSWRKREVLPFGCVPNLLLGREGVPEVNFWERGGLEKAVGVIQELLQAHSSSSSSSGRVFGGQTGQAAAHGQQLIQHHRAVLQEVLLKLVPLTQQQQQQVTGRNGSSSSSSWQLPSEAAAETLLELIELREQHEAGQRATASSSSSKSDGAAAAAAC